jgi:hypothetical protein
MRRFVLATAVITLALAGCTTAGPTTVPTNAATTAASQPAPTLSPVEIIRTGGFGGVHQSLSVDSDGRWRSDVGSGQLSAHARSRVAAILLDPALRSQVASATPDQCCDMFQYELCVNGHTYRFGEPKLGPLLTELLLLLRDETGF